MFAAVKTKLNVELFKGSSVIKKTNDKQICFTGFLVICWVVNNKPERSRELTYWTYCGFIRARFYDPCSPRTRTSVDMCLLTTEVTRGQREETPCVTAAELKRGPGALHIKERISLLINILFLRWKFQVVVIRKKENTQSRNSLRFQWKRICSRVVNLPFMGRAQGPNALNYKHAYFL